MVVVTINYMYILHYALQYQDFEISYNFMIYSITLIFCIGAVGGPGMKCFKTLVDLLKCGSDEQLTDVIQYYFVGNLSR